MRIKGWDLSFFNSGEWQVCDERLKDLEKANRPVRDGYNPGRQSLFRALRLIEADDVRCVIVAQDPYPNARFATGVSFSIPSDVGREEWPPTLRTFLEEYCTDLHLPLPSSGNLERWCERGVLLWNAVPTCKTSESLSHDWLEWEFLTKEIFSKLSEKGVVFALLGQVARRHVDCIDNRNNAVVVTSHPSPRGSRSGNTPFIGSRLFSTINDKLVNIGHQPIDWRLP